jgi:hypothetical protein
MEGDKNEKGAVRGRIPASRYMAMLGRLSCVAV